MKLRYIIPSFVAAVAMLVSCSEDYSPASLAEVQVSSSYVAIDMNGGSTDIQLTAQDAWSVVSSSVPSWLTITPAQGSAGTSAVSFKADKTLDGRSAEIQLECGGKTQMINVIQGLATISEATCAEVIKGIEGKTYRVKGTCTRIANTNYGNWYLNDGTGEIYIYGTVDAGGAYNWSSFGIEVGDEVTVEGPMKNYNGTIELVDASFVSISKSLIKVDSLMVGNVKSSVLPVEGGEITAHLTCKGNGVAVEIPADAKEWLGVTSSTVGANPTITFYAKKNEAGDRSTTVTFKTSDGSKDYTSEATISQKGSIVEVNVAQFLAAPVGTAQYRITGVVMELYSSDKQGQSFYIQDYSGKTLVYRAAGFKESGAKVGDVVTVVGQRGAYKDSPQMVSGTFEVIKYAVTPISIADFLAKPNDKNTYYMVTGTISSLKGSNGKDNDYGNLYITDGTNELYVYGCYSGYGATGNDRKFFIADNNIKVGDELTMIGYKDTYNGLVELCGGICFGFKHAE